MRVFSLILLSCLTSAAVAEVFKWHDANGNIVFGDSPPESVRASAVDLPVLTVADSYGSKSKSEDDSVENTSDQSVEEASENFSYKTFEISSPAKEEGVRANNGNVLVRFDLKPELRPGHGIVVYLDGKQVASGGATVFSLENLDRGQHSTFAVLHNQAGQVLKNTQTVTFHVLRHSVIKN